MNDIKIDRDILQANYIDRIIEGMDMDTLLTLAQEYLEAEFDRLGDSDFIAEVSVNYPDLLEE